MASVLVPTQERVFHERLPLPPDASMVVDPTKAKSLSRPTTKRYSMSVATGAASRFSAWQSLETAMDRYASYGAFALGVTALVVGLLVL